MNKGFWRFQFVASVEDETEEPVLKTVLKRENLIPGFSPFDYLTFSSCSFSVEMSSSRTSSGSGYPPASLYRMA